MKVPQDPAAAPSLDLVREPALILLRGGDILVSNVAARRLLGHDLTGGDAFAWMASHPEELEELLHRASGSTGPLPGALTVRAAAGPTRLPVDCARLPGPPPARLVLRFHRPQEDPFALLDRRVRALDAQLRRGARENEALQAALEENRTLVSELQHRVKNTIQVMIALITLSAKGEQAPETVRFVERARLRLQAMASAQEAQYRSENAGKVSIRTLLHAVVDAIRQSFPFSGQIRTEFDDADIPGDQAHALAIIAGELIANAMEHGSPSGGIIRVTFRAGEDACELVVQDGGPGVPPRASASSSGLRLVRGLCRELRGALEIGYAHGARCTVRFDRWKAGPGR